MVDPGTGTKADTIFTTNYKQVELKLPIAGTTIKVYGEDTALVTNLQLNYQSYGSDPSTKMLTLALEPMANVTELNVSDNLLQTLDLTNIPGAATIDAQNNALTAVKMAAGNKHSKLKFSNSANNGGTNNVLGVDFSACEKIADLYIESQALTSTAASFSTLTNVVQLHAANNKLTSATLPASSVMTHLFLDNNALTSLDLAPLSALKVLYVGGNKFSTIDLSKVPTLTQLDINNNELSAIDLTGCALIDNLDLSGNKLTTLDITGAPKLTALYCNNNALTSITAGTDNKLAALSANNTAGGTNALADLDFSKFPNLSLLYINKNVSTSGILDLSSCLKLGTINADECNLTEAKLPDTNLLGTISLNDNKLSVLDIKNMKTAAGWTSVYVYAQNNNISKVNWPAGKVVTRLYLDGNRLTFADLAPLSSCVKQARYFTYANQQPMTVTPINGHVDLAAQAKVGDTASDFLWTADGAEFTGYTEADGVFAFNTEAKKAVCTIINSALPNLKLTTDSIDIAAAVNLANQLLFSYTVAPEAVGKKAFFQVFSNGNQKFQIDWGNKIKSDTIAMKWGAIDAAGTIAGTTVNVYGENTQDVTRLYLQYSSYDAAPESKMLTFSAQPLPAVVDVNVSGNQLQALDLTNVPNATTIDAQNNAITAVTMAADNKHQTFKFSNSASNGGTNNVIGVDFSACASIKDMYIENQALTSTEANFSTFANVIQLHAANNKLTAATLPTSSVMTHLFLDNNALTALDVAPLSALKVLYLGGNKFSTFDMSKAPTLTQLDINHNELTALDLTGCANLDNLDVSDNQITALDLTGTPALSTLYCKNNAITALTVPADNKLSTINAENSTDAGKNALADLDFAALTKLSSLTISKNLSTKGSLDLSTCTSMGTIIASNCGLNDVKLPNSANITRVYLDNNRLSTIEVPNFKTTGFASVTMDFSNNNLTDIKIPGGKQMQSLYVEGNKLTFAQMPALSAAVKTISRFYYGKQQPMEVTVVDGRVDLSSQAKVGDTDSEFLWKSGNTVIDSYTEEAGVFTFTADVNNATCTILNAKFPKLTLTTVPVDIEKSGIEEVSADNAPVEYYNLQGVRVEQPSHGLYIRRQGNKTEKVIL